MNYKDLKVVKLVNYKIEISYKRVWSISGFGIMDTQKDELIVLGSPLPYILSRKNVAAEIVEMGLLEAPQVYKSTPTQRAAIR